MSEPEFLTTSQVQELLQIGRTKLWELVRQGAFPAFRVGGGSRSPLRYRRADVLRWLESNRVGPHEAGADATAEARESAR